MRPQSCIAQRSEEGDCYRACLASVLEVPTKEVPNFADLYDKWDTMFAAVRAWLAERGFAIFRTYCSAGWKLDKLLEAFSADNPDVPIILMGQSGTNASNSHAVVVLNGKVQHDPSGCGISGPCVGSKGQDAWWWLDIVCVSARQMPQP